MSSPKQKQQGLSLVLAIFILVVLSLLGAAMINVLAGGSESVAREVIAIRALYAAESGAQKKLNEIFPPGAVTDTSECNPGGNPTTYTAADLGGIEGCSTLSVVVECSFVTDSNSINYFTLSSVGTCGPVGSESVRVIEVQAKDIN